MQTSAAPILIVTRPPSGAAAFLSALDRQVEVHTAPALRIDELPAELPHHPDSVIFSSANGVRASARFALGGLPAYCVGARTTEVAQDHGFDARQAGQTAKDLVAHVLANGPTGRILHLRGTESRGDIANCLRSAGLDAEELVVYAQIPLTADPGLCALAKGSRRLIFPLFSPKSAQILHGLKITAPISVIAISSAVLEELDVARTADVIVSDEPTLAGMIAATRGVLSRFGVA